MLSLDAASDRASALIDRARRAGADAADAVYSADASESVSVRLGKLEDVERSESEHISLRVFAGSRSASIGSSDMSDAALDELAARAVAMARLAPEDPYAGLAPQELLSQAPFPALDLDDPAEPSPAALRTMAEAAEDAARAVKGVTNSEGGNASAGRGLFALVTSHGFSGAYATTSHGLSASVVAGEGCGHAARLCLALGPPRRGPADGGGYRHAGRAARRRKAEPRHAQKRADAGGVRPARRRHPGGPPHRRHFRHRHRAARQLPARPAGGSSCSTARVVIAEVPHRPRGLRSRPFDGEGLATAPRNLVENGKVTGWLLDSASARQLGLPPTGHASRGHGGAPGVGTSNLHLAAGSVTPAQLMADIKDGVYITELIGMGVNGVTGDYSRGASGVRIVNGELAGPVAEFTIAGNLLEMFRALTPADDLEWHRVVNVPTMRVDGMVVAGD